MTTSKIAFIIQARMSSHRFPGKVLMPLPLNSAIPMLGRIVEGLEKTEVDKDIIVATSRDMADQAIAEFCRKQKLRCFRGDTENVLSRYQQLVREGSYKTVVRYTGDNPFVDPGIIKELINFHTQERADLTFPVGLPLGLHAEIVEGRCLLELEEKQLNTKDKEHVTWYFKQRQKEYRVRILDFKQAEPIQQIRLTVDYPSDMALAALLWSLKETSEEPLGLSFIREKYRENPWIFQINAGNFQKIPPVNLEEERAQAIRILKKLDLNYAAGVLVNSFTNKKDRID